IPARRGNIRKYDFLITNASAMVFLLGDSQYKCGDQRDYNIDREIIFKQADFFSEIGVINKTAAMIIADKIDIFKEIIFFNRQEQSLPFRRDGVRGKRAQKRYGRRIKEKQKREEFFNPLMTRIRNKYADKNGQKRRRRDQIARPVCPSAPWIAP